jgi:hypothetical protein
MVGEPVKHPNIAQGIHDSRLCRLYYYWRARKGDRRFPARSDIDPLDFGYVLGNVILFDVMRNPLRFRVRVHGTEMVRRAGYDLTGKFLDDLPITDYRRYVRERCEGLVHDGEPLVILLGAMELRYFEDFYRSVSEGNQGSIVLVRSDGVMLVR